MREWVNNNPMLATMAATALLVGALGVVAWQFRGSGSGLQDGYWLNLETGEFFVEQRHHVSPMDDPSGGRAYRANLYACGRCSPESWFGYVEGYSEAYFRAISDGSLDRMNPMDAEAFMDRQEVVASIEDGEFVPRESPAGQRMMSQIFTRCPAETPRVECRP